jgi:hypothetical protein
LCGGLAQVDPIFAPETKKDSAMTGTLITLGLAVLAVWLLVDSAVEFIRDGEDVSDPDTLATEP